LPLHPHSPFNVENKNSKLWRYMSFSKFIALLENQSLFFARSDKLSDPCEGSYPKLSVAELKKYILDPKAANPTTKQAEATRETLRYTMMISCWNKREVDSYLMWKAYTDSIESICIQTNVDTLFKCLDAQQNYHVLVSDITYIDYESEEIPHGNILSPFVYKRHYFREETELRAMIWLPGDEWRYIENALPPDSFPVGLEVPVMASTLIQSIYLHPEAPSWHRELVKKIAQKYSLTCAIEKSDIQARPIF